ncbi:hypothetical protein [Lachnobacterium bovis]|nr:hypothetical protein [Lachnobacterium bovis]
MPKEKAKTIKITVKCSVNPQYVVKNNSPRVKISLVSVILKTWWNL